MTERPLPADARISALGRRLDLRRPSNRFALLATGVVLLASTGLRLLLGEAGLGAGARAGAVDALGVFLAWALARELAPDHPRAARYATLMATPLLLLAPPALLPLVALLAAARWALRTTGLRPRPADLAVAVLLAAIAATGTAGLAPALALAAVVAWDARVDRPDPRPAYVVAVAAAVVAVVAAVVGGPWDPAWRLPNPGEALLVLVILAGAVRLETAPPRTTGDHTPTPLDADRLLAARRTVAATLLGALLWSGGVAVGALGPGWAALLATIVHQRLRRRLQASTDARQ